MTQPIKTELDYEMENHIRLRSCYTLTELPYSQRCDYIRHTPDCRTSMRFFNYIQIANCNFSLNSRADEWSVILLFGLFCMIYVVAVAYIADNFLAPVLKIISRALHMSEHLAGATLLAMGNSLADFFSNLSSIDHETPLYANCLASSIFMILVGGGLVCYVSPFRMNTQAVVRDILFFILGALVLEFTIMNGIHTSMYESIYLIAIYVCYLIVNILDLFLVKRAILSIQKELVELRNNRRTTEAETVHEQKLKRTLFKLLRDSNIDIKQIELHLLTSFRGSHIGSSRKHSFMNLNQHQKIVDTEETRNEAYDPTQSKHSNVFSDFLQALNPVNMDEWHQGGCLIRTFIVIKAPILFLLLFLLPRVDYEERKHAWCKLLHCIQLITTTSWCTMLIMAMWEHKKNDWYLSVNPMYLLYPLPISVPLAIIIFLHARVDLPPRYFIIFVVYSFACSMFGIFLCAREIEWSLDAIGILLHCSEGFMGATVAVIAGSVTDVASNFAMAMHGYEQMAYAACIGGPFFSTIFTVGIIFLLQGFSATHVHIRHGNFGEISFIFVMITLWITLFWAYLFNFRTRRSLAVLNFILYAIFILIVILIEYEVIHNYERERYPVVS